MLEDHKEGHIKRQKSSPIYLLPGGCYENNRTSQEDNFNLNKIIISISVVHIFHLSNEFTEQ